MTHIKGFNVGDKVRLVYSFFGYAPGLPRVGLPAGSLGVIVRTTYGAYVVECDGYQTVVPPDGLEAVAP
jgi:hypothetical protein